MKVLFAVAMIVTLATSVLAQDGGGLELQAAAHDNDSTMMGLPPPDFQTQPDLQGIQSVPEPSTLALGGLALGLIAIMHRKSAKRFNPIAKC
jgi:hypothetical protein